MNNIKIAITLLCSMLWVAFEQGQSIQRAEPLHWWVGMHNPELQIVLYGSDIGDCEVKLPKAGMQLKKVQQVENSNYLFLDVEILGNAQAGTYPIELYKKGKKVLTRDYVLKARGKTWVRGGGSQPAALITWSRPIRFFTGVPRSDWVKVWVAPAWRRAPSHS